MANPIVGKYASPTSIFETTNTQMHPIGARGVLADRSFRYAKFVAATAIGPNKLAQMCPPVAEHVTEASDPWVAGAYSVAFTPAAVDIQENEYSDGYIKIEGGTNGIGQIRKLRPHSFGVQSVAKTFELWDSVLTTTTGSETASLIHNPWANVVIQPTSITAPAAGVTMVNWPACTTTTGTSATAPLGYLTASYSAPTYTYVLPQYGWLQTWGLASCLIDTTNIVAGSYCIVGGTAGTLGLAVESDIKQRVAVAVEAMSTNSVYASVFLQIAP